MKHARAITRTLSILIVTGVLYLLWLLGMVLSLKSARRRNVIRRHIVRTWARALKSIMGMQVEVVGSPPAPPFCLVANHLSYVDALLMLNCVYGILISRADVRQWPLVGHLAWLAGTLFIDRTSPKDVVRLNQGIEEAFLQGEGIIFFPEGTSTRGVNVGSFNSSLLAYPATSSVPVHYASIGYKTDPDDPPAAQAVCWWGDMTFLEHLYDLLTIRRFRTLIHFGENPVTHSDRKELTNILRDKIEMNFVPVIQEIQ